MGAEDLPPGYLTKIRDGMWVTVRVIMRQENAHGSGSSNAGASTARMPHRGTSRPTKAPARAAVTRSQRMIREPSSHPYTKGRSHSAGGTVAMAALIITHGKVSRMKMAWLLIWKATAPAFAR
eukprot:1202410-Prymnesium_polylepis.1